jgi:hypothetical protein
MDITQLPAGFGAVFVPALEEPTDASVVVFYEGEIIANGKLAERIPLPPGRYRIAVGNGPITARAVSDVTVVRGVTTTVQPMFAIVRVSLVNGDAAPAEDTYVISSADGTRTYGPFTTSLRPGARTSQIWVLPPGKYLFALGTTTKADENVATLSVAAGEVVHYRAVISDGRLVRTEFGDPNAAVASASPWRVKLVLGADLALSQRKNQLSSYNGDVLQAGGFGKFRLGLDTGRHLAELELFADESFIALTSNRAADVPLQKVVDDVSAELVYNYRVAGVVGPYAHAISRNSIFKTNFSPDTNITVDTTDTNGAHSITNSDRTKKVKLFGYGFPLFVQEGVGLGSAYDNTIVRIGLRGGGAIRQSFYSNSRYVTGLSDANVLSLTKLKDTNDLGLEATAFVGFTVRQLVSFDSRFDLFVPADDINIVGDKKYRPVFRFDNMLTIRLSRVAALVYTIGLKRDAAVLDDTQLAQTLRVRLQSTVF